MEAILRVSRSRQHALTTALRVDMAYLCVDVRTVFSLLLAPLFSVIFQGEAYGDGFGYRMGVIMTVFICAMWVLTMAVADLQNGYRLRGIIPASRKSQVAARLTVLITSCSTTTPKPTAMIFSHMSIGSGTVRNIAPPNCTTST